MCSCFTSFYEDLIILEYKTRCRINKEHRMRYSQKRFANKKIMKEIISVNWDEIRDAGHSIKNDIEIMMCAINQNSNAFSYASFELKNDMFFVKKVVSIDGTQLQHAGFRMKNTHEVARIAVKNNPEACQYIGDSLRYSVEFAMFVADVDPMMLKYFNKSIRSDESIMENAINKDPSVVRFTRGSILNNREVCKRVVEYNGMLLYHFNSVFLSDVDIVLAAIKQNKGAFRYASFEIKHYKRFIQKDTAPSHLYKLAEIHARARSKLRFIVYRVMKELAFKRLYSPHNKVVMDELWKDLYISLQKATHRVK